ncbi:hypothetical protein [Endozoicomonas sp. 8E]|uniref:hypothetical protein n=1 Tax=Endozoicomonas sp. 8E TaxID=3035692 RepID=UPI0029394C9C|nr:hypothetical protein [Endozoicomonas sp. 8E]WOG25757.1 hypothetical protein P6910_14350 [Endozoicomonas sp. 8E]
MKKTYYALAVCRFLSSCFMMQLATIQLAEAVNNLSGQMSLSSLLPLIATVYRNIPETKHHLPDLNTPPQPAQHVGGRSCPFDTRISVVSPQYSQIKLQATLAAGNGFDSSDNRDLDAVENPLTCLLRSPLPLSIRYAESGIPVLFEDAIWLRLNQEESLILAPSELPAVVRVGDIAGENWPQLIAAESVQSYTGSIRSVFRWANKLILDSLSDDPLLRFLAFTHGTAFYIQDSNGQPSYIIQHNGKLLFISRVEACLRFSQFSQNFLESLYPEIFGPSLPAGGGWHEWNRFIRKKPFHPGHSERTPEPDTASTERDGRQKQINPQKIEAAGGNPPSGDGRMFSGDGRLLQVEYAGEAVSLGLCVVGVKSADTVVLAARKKSLQLLESHTIGKIVRLDEHVHLAFAGLSADARILIRKAQLECQSFRLSYEDAMDINCIARHIAEIQQKATHSAGCRPYGVACIIGGFNMDGTPQLWQTEPAGVCASWKACSVGQKSKAVLELMEKEYKDDMSRDETIKFALKGLLEVADSSARNVELLVLERDHSSRWLDDAELEQLVTVLNKEREEEAATKKRPRDVQKSAAD